MKKIIMQHYTGDLSDIAKLSIENIRLYAKKIGADYKFITGNLFHPTLSSPCQKMHILDEIFDDYDVTVIMDTDMFVTKKNKLSIFDDTEGIGIYSNDQKRVFSLFKKRHPNFANSSYPYLGGCIWRMNVDLRRMLRKHIVEDEILQFDKSFEDEAIFHRLATRAGLKQYNTLEEKWGYGSFYPNLDEQAIIHIRPKVYPGNKHITRTKMENYTVIKDQGVI
jgi:hypothetical protein